MVGTPPAWAPPRRPRAVVAAAVRLTPASRPVVASPPRAVSPRPGRRPLAVVGRAATPLAVARPLVVRPPTPYVVPVPVARDLISALRERFRGAPALASLTEIYNREAESGAERPYLVINQIGEDAVPVTYSPTYPAWAEFQFAVVDDVPERGAALRDAAFLELAPVVKPRLVFADGRDTGGRIPGRKWEVRQPGAGKQGRWAWAFFFGYRFYLTRFWKP